MKFDKRLAKPAGLLLAAIIGFSIINATIPDLFREETSKKLAEKAQAAYEAEVDAAYDAMIRQYDEDMLMYADAVEQYEADCIRYSQEVAQNAADIAVYDEEFMQLTEQYRVDMETYSAELEKYTAAYAAEYANAEEAMLRAGVPFKVAVSKATIQSAEIGSDWLNSYYVNDEECLGFYGSNSVSLKLNSNVAFYSEIIEQDNAPDIGTARSNHTMTREDFESGFSMTHTVAVRENRGPNTGNTCIFEVTYTLTPEEYTVVVDPDVLPTEPIVPTEPLYAPPKLSLSEPTAPVEPIFPIVKNIGIPIPDIDGIVATNAEVYAHSQFATILRYVFLICAIPTTAFLAIWLLKARRNAKKEDKERLVEELKQEFVEPEVRPTPKYCLPVSQSYKNEEEKRINIRFLKHLDFLNQQHYAIHHHDFLKSKASSQYLNHNIEVKRQLDEMICDSEELLESFHSTLLDMPDPLCHLRETKGIGSTIRKSPFSKLPFSKKTKNPELSSFFLHSDATYFEADANTIYVFTAFHILKYIVSEYRFEVDSYRSVSVELVEGSTTKVNLKNPEKVDVISVSWLYQTKSGKPDKRRVDNPATYVIYDGAVVFCIESHTIEKHFSKKDSAEKALEEAKNFITLIAEDSGRKAILEECLEEFSEKEYSCPEFFKL